MKANLTDIRARISQAVQTHPIGSAFERFELEEDRDDEGGEFIRVIFHSTPKDVVSDRELLGFARIVEDAVEAVDDRFASVRFADAA